MPENYISYIVTTGGCSCDLFSEEPEEDEQEKRISKLRRKYKRKGWSDAKIERSISQAISAAQAPRKAGLRDDLRFYLSDVIEELNEMRIVIHWYNSGVETEEISIARSLFISNDDFRNKNPIRISDTLFIIN